MVDQATNLRNIIKVQNQIQPANNRGNSPGNSRIITVTSGKGGVGKSSLAINLAIQFRRQGKSVIIFDADFGLANIEVMFGAIPQYNLADMIFKGKDIKDILIKGPLDIGFISGGSGIRGLSNMSRDQVAYLVYKIKELEALADIIIIDTGAGISDSVLEFVSACSEVLLIATPEPTSITDAYALLKSLNSRAGFEKETTFIKVIANRVADEEEGRNLYNKLNVVVSKFLNINFEFLGIVPADNNISRSVMQQKPVVIAYPHSPASAAIDELALKLLDRHDEINKKKKGLSQVFVKLFSKNS